MKKITVFLGGRDGGEDTRLAAINVEPRGAFKLLGSSGYELKLTEVSEVAR